jgi:redox-regulated HSP33 family molecular chaperone
MEQRKPFSMNSLTEEEKLILNKIQSEELLCDWCNEPLYSKLIFDEYEPDVLAKIEVFCKSCNRVYSINPKSVRYWDDIIEQITRNL